MIYIYQNKTNKVMTRFFDKRKNVDSYFLWKIVNDFTKKEVWFITNDISPNTCYYNLFELEHSNTCIPYVEPGYVDIGYFNSALCLDSGHNEYTVYETTELSLDQQYIIGEIERDIMFVEIIRDVNNTNSQVNNVYY